jgi:hypothetical protein
MNKNRSPIYRGKEKDKWNDRSSWFYRK